MEQNAYINKNGSYSHTCPNCGAAIEGEKCKYCGTVFIDFACLDLDNPFFIKIKKGGAVYIAKVVMNDAIFEEDMSRIYMERSYLGQLIAYNRPKMNLTLKFTCFDLPKKVKKVK